MSTQLDLINYGQYARATSVEAYLASMPKLRERKRIIIEAIARMSNPTRDSLSEHTVSGCKVSAGRCLN